MRFTELSSASQQNLNLCHLFFFFCAHFHRTPSNHTMGCGASVATKEREGTPEPPRDYAKIIEDVEVIRMRDEAKMRLGGHWAEQPVVVCLLRRWG